MNTNMVEKYQPFTWPTTWKNSYKRFYSKRGTIGILSVSFVFRSHCPASSPTLHCRAFIIAWACLSSAQTNRENKLAYHKVVWWDGLNGRTVRKGPELTCKQNSKFVSRDRNDSCFCGARHWSLCLQFKLYKWFIYFPQFTGTQSVVNTPRHSV